MVLLRPLQLVKCSSCMRKDLGWACIRSSLSQRRILVQSVEEVSFKTKVLAGVGHSISR